MPTLFRTSPFQEITEARTDEGPSDHPFEKRQGPLVWVVSGDEQKEEEGKDPADNERECMQKAFPGTIHDCLQGLAHNRKIGASLPAARQCGCKDRAYFDCERTLKIAAAWEEAWPFRYRPASTCGGYDGNR